MAGNILTQRVGTATTTFDYDNRGRLTRTTDALGQTETFTYDANGFLLTKTDRNGTVFHHTYDRMGRLTRQEARQNNIVAGHNAYTYTATGAVRTETNGSHTITNSYDAQGRLVRQEETGGIIKTYTHNTANNRTSSRIYVNNQRFIDNAYAYDTAQRLHTVRSNGELISTDTYDANGALASTTLGNGVRTDYTRNLAGLPTSVVNRNGNTTLSSFNYTYHLDGNISQITEVMGGVARTINHTYDTARRLTREQSAGGGIGAYTHQYEFDNRGNRSRKTATGAETYTINYTYDLNNRLLTEARTGSSPRTTTYTYDRNGNQLTQTPGDAIQSLSYNVFNQQIGFVAASGNAGGNFTYRADGLRHIDSAMGNVRNYAWNGSHIVLERNNSGAVVNIFNRTPNGRLIRSSAHGWYLYNARGDIVQRTDNNRNILHTYRYTAFGIEPAPVYSINRFRFAGEFWDSWTGTYYLRNRNYNPRTGRFTQPDPLWNNTNSQCSPLAILQASNLYVYTMNNPIRWIDPSGLSAKSGLSEIQIITALAVGGNMDAAHALAQAVVSGNPISIAQSGNNVGIVAFVDISGGYSPIGNVAEINRIATSLGLPTRTEQTHREAVVHGLANLWAGSFDGLNVSVTIIERGNSAIAYSPGQAFLSIDIIDGGGVSHLDGGGTSWSTTNPGKIVLFTHHAGGAERTFSQAAWTAAHELGHAMGIDDGWGFGYERHSTLDGQRIVESIYQYGNIVSMMTQPLDPVTRFDVEMVLRAHRYNEWQTWNNNPLLPLAIRR